MRDVIDRLLDSPEPAIRRLVAGQIAGLAVLSYQEVTAVQAAIETVGVVRGAESIAA